MKILIVEDETAAYENLADMILSLDSSIEIMGNTESVRQTVRWLQANPKPDLLFMDIHLSDGSAFAIFDQIEVETPIIFTTAYDQYAIDAFKVNSIDYLLKPVKPEELNRSLEKFSRWNQQDVLHYLSQLTQLSLSPKYKDKLLIPVKDKLLPIGLNEVYDINEYFKGQQKESLSRDTKRQEERLQKAVYGNLKLMKSALSDNQYRKYVTLLNVTNNNNRLTGAVTFTDIYLADNK